MVKAVGKTNWGSGEKGASYRCARKKPISLSVFRLEANAGHHYK